MTKTPFPNQTDLDRTKNTVLCRGMCGHVHCLDETSEYMSLCR